MMRKENLQYKNIKDFTTEDTIYMRLPEGRNHSIIVLAQFVSYDEKKKLVTGKVLESTVNPNLYTNKIESGWEATTKLESCALYGKVANSNHTHTHWFDALGYAAYETIDKMKDLVPGKHPTYGLARLSRSYSNKAHNLFGSGIKHANVIRLQISTAEINRTLNTESIMQDKAIIEIEMSEAQFANMITSFNQSDGTPVTITRREGEGLLGECPWVSKQEQYSKDFQQEMANFRHSMQLEVAKAKTILESGKAPNKGERQIILDSLSTLTNKLSSSLPFVADQFADQMERTVQDAKSEIEALFTYHAEEMQKKIEQGGGNVPIQIEESNE